MKYRLACCTLLFMFALALHPAGALAHTKLVSSEPADGATLAEPPGKVTLTYSTDVSETLQEVQVLAPDGSNIAGEPKKSGTTATIPIEGQATGEMTVSWRTLGADGHPIKGSFAYLVRKPRDSPPTPETSTTPATPSEVPTAAIVEDYPREPISWLASVARFVFYLALLTVAGGGLFAAAVARRWRPRYFRRACWALILSSLTMFFTNLALAGEYSVLGLINPWNIAPHLITPHGRVSVGCAVVAALLLAGYRVLKAGAKRGDDSGRRIVVILSVLLACIPAFGGHAIASQQPFLRVPADMLHLLAASIWFGGIVQLQGVARVSYSAHPAVYPTVTRFARLAFASVVTLVVTGVIASWLEIGLDVGELFGSTYGRLVLVKVALLGLTIPLARANQQRHLPALQEQTRRASVNLRRYVVFELALVMAVIAVTTWLVYETPPRHEKMGHDLHMSHQR